jgi:hypothetical protein
MAMKVTAFGFVYLVDDRNVGVLQLGGGLGLLHEALTAIGVGDELRRQYLEGYLAVELGVDGSVTIPIPPRLISPSIR